MAGISVALELPQGPARFVVDPANHPERVLVLGHGAGGGVDAADLSLLARELPGTGTTVVRFEQPWRTAGRRVAAAPPRLDEAWLAALEHLREPPWDGLALFTGGRSAGARVACRTATAVGARGVVCLAFPLHLPGRPERSRAPELLAPLVPRLVLQGTRDAFGSADDVRAAAAGTPGIEVVDLPGADHGFRLPAGQPGGPAAQRALLVSRVRTFVETGIPGA